MFRQKFAGLVRRFPLVIDPQTFPAHRKKAVDPEGFDFDWNLYLSRYPDLGDAGIHSEADAWAHWIEYGRDEGRWAAPQLRPPRETLLCPSVDSIYLRATGDLVCWDDAGNDTVLQAPGGDHHYGHDVWLGEPFEDVRRQLWKGRMPFPETCQKCLVLQTRGVHSSEAVDRRRVELLQVEPSYYCSLDCPGCVPLAVRRAAPPQNLDPRILNRILSDFSEAKIDVDAIDFQGHGEPLLHPDVWGLARLAKHFFPDAFLSITTNCQAVLTDRTAPQVLDEIVCAIDGADEESYQRYRVGGSFSLATGFMKDFATLVRRGGHSTRVVWKYVLFRHNSSHEEVCEAQRIAEDAGIHELRFVFTRNGEATNQYLCEEDLPRPPQGLRQSLSRHEPDVEDLQWRLDDAEARVAAGDNLRASHFALSIARNFSRFFHDTEDLLEPHRQILRRLVDLTLDLDEPSQCLVNDLVAHLHVDTRPGTENISDRSPNPTPEAVAVTLDLVQACRRNLAYAPLVTGLRPLYQDDRTLYPQFVTSADGCRLIDTCGRVYLDWMSGYGSVVLGYRRCEVEEAIREQLACGPVLPFGHPLEVEVAGTLKGLIPCAERVGFGKNGSDAVTAAVRIARLVTGRGVILFHGYHGFHDWYAASNPQVGGIPATLSGLIQEFRWGDIENIERLFAENPGKVAAVVMEPMKQFVPEEGYLEQVRALAHRNGALLIFDEIVTGFRVALGGVQELIGVTPDMACFGKAMANGWSISALAGREDLMDQWPRVGVDMTWRAETPSLAAARSVLAILESEDVIPHLSRIGSRLQVAFDGLARGLGLAARLTGHPSRLNISFDDHGGLRGHRILEWFIDECLRRGVVTNGTLLPNASHDDRAVEDTIAVFERALGRLQHAVSAGSMYGLGAPKGPWVAGCIDRLEQTGGDLSVGGWMLAEDGFPLAIEVESAAGRIVPAEKTRRADVARDHPTIGGAQNSGWSVRLDQVEFTDGNNQWSFVMRATRGARTVVRCHLVHPVGFDGADLPIMVADGELIETSEWVPRLA